MPADQVKAAKIEGGSWKGKFESAFWTLAGLVVFFYGTGQHDLLTVVLHDKRLNRLFVWLGIINVFLNALLFLYAYAWLGYVKGIRDPVSSGTWAVPAGAVTFATTFISFIIALWPVFGFLAIGQVVVITYGVVSALNFLPGVGPLRVERKGRKEKL